MQYKIVISIVIAYIDVIITLLNSIFKIMHIWRAAKPFARGDMTNISHF